jgi:hypothetical protein
MSKFLATSVALILSGMAATSALAQQQASVSESRSSGFGVNLGSLNCRVAGGVGFVVGSSKDVDCQFLRPDGVAEHYVGSVNKFGVDIGFTTRSKVVWLVFAPGDVARGALSGSYGGATVSATVGLGVGANVLVGGSNSQITLQPVSAEGSVGLDIAGGIGEVNLRYAQ